jgi:hypothetical protein
MGAPVVHFEINTADDPAELHGFYANLFGWSIDANNPMNYGLVTTGAGKGVDGGIGGAQDGTPSICFYVEVPDITATLAAAEAAGGKTLMPREVVTDAVVVGMFADPQGNVVGLVEPSEPAA